MSGIFSHELRNSEFQMATRDDSKIFRGWIWDDGFFTDGFVFLSEHRLTGDPGYGEPMDL